MDKKNAILFYGNSRTPIADEVKIRTMNGV